MNWLKGLKNLGHVDTKAKGKLSNDVKNKETLAYSHHAMIYNALVLDIIRIQGLEMTLEEMRKMDNSLRKLDTCEDNVKMAAWSSHVRLSKIASKA